MKGVNDLPFPDINLSKPSGEEYVSKIDDFERETRSWIKQILNIITGYPLIETIAVKVWDTLNRPTAEQMSSLSGRVLLGFNSDTNQLEVVGSDGTINGVASQVIDTIYPIGTYYETSDPNFNPNTAWGGTWVLDTPGRVMVSQGRKKDAGGNVITGSHNFEADEIGGEEEHCLARPELPSLTNGVSEMPIHYHPHRHPHSHLVGGVLQTTVQGETPIGYLVTTGSVGVKVNNAVKSGLPNEENSAYSMGIVDNEEIGWYDVSADYSLHGMVDADTPKPSEQRTVSEDLIMHVGSKIGLNGHNNLQPYKVCYRWHRIPDPEEDNG